MRLFITVLFALIAAVLARPAALKTVIVSYPNDTPSSVVDKAINEVTNAGGIVTHEYCTFAPNSSLRVLDMD